jgi:hypothetical protein
MALTPPLSNRTTCCIRARVPGDFLTQQVQSVSGFLVEQSHEIVAADHGFGQFNHPSSLEKKGYHYIGKYNHVP